MKIELTNLPILSNLVGERKAINNLKKVSRFTIKISFEIKRSTSTSHLCISIAKHLIWYILSKLFGTILHAYEYNEPIGCDSQLTQIGRGYPANPENVRIPMQDYKSLHVAVMICATQWRH